MPKTEQESTSVERTASKSIVQREAEAGIKELLSAINEDLRESLPILNRRRRDYIGGKRSVPNANVYREAVITKAIRENGRSRVWVELSGQLAKRPSSIFGATVHGWNKTAVHDNGIAAKVTAAIDPTGAYLLDICPDLSLLLGITETAEGATELPNGTATASDPIAAITELWGTLSGEQKAELTENLLKDSRPTVSSKFNAEAYAKHAKTFDCDGERITSGDIDKWFVDNVGKEKSTADKEAIRDSLRFFRDAMGLPIVYRVPKGTTEHRIRCNFDLKNNSQTYDSVAMRVRESGSKKTLHTETTVPLLGLGE